mgnify:CR=1 FL=1
MKKIILSLATILSFFFVSNAQSASGSQNLSDRWRNNGDNQGNYHVRKGDDERRDDRRSRRDGVDDTSGPGDRNGGKRDKHRQLMKGLSAEQKKQVRQEFKRHRAAISGITGREFHGGPDGKGQGRGLKRGEGEGGPADGGRFRRDRNDDNADNNRARKPVRYHKSNHPTLD